MQGENDLYRLSARNDTTLHISSDTNVNAKKGEYFVPAHAVRNKHVNTNLVVSYECPLRI